MRRKPMHAEVPAETVLSHRQDRQALGNKQAELPLDDVSAKREIVRQTVAEAGNSTVGDWFDAAVSAYPKAAALAAELGVTEAYISQFRSGERSIPLRAILPLLAHADSAIVLLTAMCEAAGFAPPKRPRKVSKAQVDAAVTRKVRTVLALWSMVRAEAAAELGTTVVDVDAALDDVAEAVEK